MERFDYFKNVENRYKSKISLYRPVVIRLDGKNICKNKEINILDESEGSFAYVLKRTAKYLSFKYKCYVFIASDELNIVFGNPKSLYRHFKSVDTQKITSLIAQEVFYYFNKYFKKQLVYFDARIFVIPQDKFKSYLIYRRNCAMNVLTQYFAKLYLGKEYRINLKLEQIIENLKERCPEYDKRTSYQIEGFLYLNGDRYNVSDFINSLDEEEKLV